MQLRFLIFFVVMMSVSGAINWHVYRRVTKVYRLGPKGRWAVLALTLGSLAGTVLARVAREWLHSDLRPLLFACGALQLIVILTALFTLPLDLLRLGEKLWRAVRRPSGALPAEKEATQKALAARTPEAAKVILRTETDATLAADATPALSRRSFLEQAGVTSSLLIASSTSLYGTLKGRQDYRIEEVGVRLPGLKPTLDGFSIVQLSDVHIGAQVGESELAAAFELVKRAKPDLIVLTGDLLDHDARLAGQLGHFVSRLGPLARNGVVAITGNHDFYAGVDPTCRALEAAGAVVLRNRGIVMGDEKSGGFALLGVDDVMAPRFSDAIGADLPTALESLPQSQGLPRVLLCHNPEYFEEAAGKVDLQLSGHTHGGQLNLGISPANLFLPHPWISGRYEHLGSTIYVNRGFGTVGPPARLGAPPEVTRLVLQA